MEDKRGGETVEALGLSPGTEYTFRAKARNGEGVETAFGPGAALTTFAERPFSNWELRW